MDKVIFPDVCLPDGRKVHLEDKNEEHWKQIEEKIKEKKIKIEEMFFTCPTGGVRA